MNLQETIRRILKEESKKDKLIDKYITSLIKPENGKYNHDSKRFDMNGNSGKLNAVIFFNNRNQAMEVMIDENILEQVFDMFSLDGWIEINDYLVKWFQDNFDGLEDLSEVTTFDNDEYAY
jgi:hypothetical protein